MKSKKDRTPTARAQLELAIRGSSFKISADVPTGPSTARRMLPVFRSVGGSIISDAIDKIEKQGRSVSCSAGCGACCRQMVPLSRTEITHIKDLVRRMPLERRQQVSTKFADAVARLETAGLIDALRAKEKPVGPEYHDLGLAYFREGIACPFLDDESCSIHEDRPLVCREYLVVSKPENCRRENGQPIEVLGIPLKASKALAKIDGDENFTRWIPMILALEQPDRVEKVSSGSEIAERFFGNLVGSNLS